MSITLFLNKIKGYLGIDKYMVMYLSIVVLVSIMSFYLGQKSVSNTNTNEHLTSGQSLNTKPNTENVTLQTPDNPQGNGKYLASKNGKLYYSAGCSSAKRISQKNLVWFNTKDEAENEGYKFASSCK